MNRNGVNACNLARGAIYLGNYPAALQQLRFALRQTHNRRAWSKLMLAIRELSRIAPESEGTAQES